MRKTVFAIVAHPDDIEFMMAGTMLLLRQLGWQLHYMNIANGSCGSMTRDARKTAQIRLQESKEAAKNMGATFHASLVDDLMIYYTPELVAKLSMIFREVNPTIMLLPSPEDYMEDHMNVSRLGVTAAFSRNIPNFVTDPPSEIVDSEMAVYHAMPVGLCNQLRQIIHPDIFVDIEPVLQAKRELLGRHRSQKLWLDETQGMDCYIKSMEGMSAKVGRLSGKFEFAEGWRRHSHLGFGPEGFDPLSDSLKELIYKGD